MEQKPRTTGFQFLWSLLIWGSLWGIFEATVGYLLHLLPLSIGWLVWYPVACFFMAGVYRSTGRILSIPLIGLLSAAIKMLNLLLPGSIDRVINPAVSILFESLTLAAAVFLLNKFLGERRRTAPVKALAALGMNTGWRLLFVLYLLLLVPDWIRDRSVISAMDKFIPFFVTYNLVTSLVLFVGYHLKPRIMKPVEAAEQRLLAAVSSVPARVLPAVKTGLAVVLLGASIALELLL